MSKLTGDDDEEIIDPDDFVEKIDESEIEKVINDVSAQNALVVYKIQPPEELEEREKEVWRQVMDSVMPGHLAEKDMPSLANYCRLIAEIEFCDEQIKRIKSYSNFDPLDKNYYDAYKVWSARRSAAAALMLRMAKSMRLTNQSFRQDNKTVNTITQKSELWNTDQ